MPHTPLVPVPHPRPQPNYLWPPEPPRAGAGSSAVPGSTETPLPRLTLQPAVPRNGPSGSNPGGVMPRPGETFLGFRLVEELGRGTFGRVFLAHQEALAGRAVALKVTSRPSREAERLARLQHTNVVPVYSVHAAPPVQVICMPFVGRRTVADLLTRHRIEGSRPLSTVRAMNTRRSSAPGSSRSRVGPASAEVRSPAELPAAPPPATDGPVVGDVRAVLRTLSQLADGLAHAHARGILHLDLKPANVLVADTGEPMLLDFNLSYDAAESAREAVGGTVPYMAPEQLQEWKAGGRGGVDARTDLYSLGVMAWEMLTGEAPFPPPGRGRPDLDALLAARRAGPPPLREHNPQVTPAVESIVRKLLAPAPADRYQSAAELKEDLDRQLADRPLRFAREGSLAERAAKWRRRNPRTLGHIALVVMGVLVVGCGLVAAREAHRRTSIEATASGRRTRDALDGVRLDLSLSDPADRARGANLATKLLAEYGLPDDPGWKQKGKFRAIPEADRGRLAGDLGELLVLLARYTADGKPGGSADDRRAAAAEALRLNRAAADCFAEASTPPYLARQRAYLEAAAAGLPPPEPGPPPPSVTARDHFLDAAEALAGGRHADAVRGFEKAVAEQPSHAAAQFLLAACRHHQGQYDRALERYDMAVVLMPHDPRPPLRRGAVFGLQNRPAEAEAEFTKALDIDPELADGYRQRGLARAAQKNYAGADEDLTAALDRKSSPLQTLLSRSGVRAAAGDPAGAAADRRAAVEYTPEDVTDYLARGNARLADDPRAALADYEAAERLRPGYAAAVLNQAHVLSHHLHDEPAAVAALTRIVDRDPDAGRPRASLAVFLARAGKRDEAHRQAEQVRIRPAEPATTYQVARVYAITAATHPEDAPKAAGYLRRAVRDGFRDLRAVDPEPDFAAVRGHPELVKLIETLKTLER